MSALHRWAAALAVLSSTAFAAGPPPPEPFSLSTQALLALAGEREAPPDADVELLVLSHAARIDEQGRVTRSEHRIYRVLTARGAERFAELEEDYAPWYQQKPELRARVVTAAGEERTLDPKTIANNSADTGEPAMFTDSRKLRAPLPAVAQGSIVETHTVVAESAPFFSAGTARWIPLVSQSPSRVVRITLEFPTSLPVKYRVEKLELTPTVTTAGGSTRVVFERRDLTGKNSELPEPFAPPEHARFPSVQYATGTSWQALATAYGAWVDRQLKDSDLAARARQLAGNERDPKKVAGKLLEWVTSTVRYTGLEFGIASIEPRTPRETLERQYGDCKDLSTLLVGLLRARGMDAHVALVKTWGAPPPAELPGLGWFDHAVVHVRAPIELWIDPTAKTTPVGELPSGAQGRPALTAARNSTALVALPTSSSKDNLYRKHRRITLAEIDEAEVTERWEMTGSIAAGFRSRFEGVTEAKLKEWGTGYAKSALRAEELVSIKVIETRAGHPFQLEVSAKGSRLGSTRDAVASASLAESATLDWMPDPLTDEEEGTEETVEDPAGADGSGKGRRTPFEFSEPYRGELAYTVVYPDFLEPSPLPSTDAVSFGPAKLTRTFTQRKGSIEARHVFDSGPRRYTPEQFEAFRAAYRTFLTTDSASASFEHRGNKLMAQRRWREAVDLFRSLIARHPREALHRLQLANVLSDLGLNDQALELIDEAVAVEPTSGAAHRVRAHHLEHDAFYRRFGAGSSREEAIKGYREAKRLNPKDPSARAALAILLEHDARGMRYAPGSNLDEAIQEYQALREELKEDAYDDNLLVALMRAGRFKETRATALELQPGNVRNQALVIGTAKTAGLAAAIAEANRLEAQGSGRAQLLAGAAATLGQLREYPLATALLKEAASRASNAAELTNRAAIIARVQPHEQLDPPEDDPRRPVVKLTRAALLADDLQAAVTPLLTRSARADEDGSQGGGTVAELRATLRASGVPPQIALDFGLSLTTMTVEGDDRLGHRITSRTSTGKRAERMIAYVVREENERRIQAFDKTPYLLGREALRRVEAGDLEGARQWLSWARELYPPDASAGDEPYLVFAMLWAPGQTGDARTLRRAAAALTAQGRKNADAVKLLEDAARSEPDPARSWRYQLATLPGHLADKRWAEAEAIARAALLRHPRSARSFNNALLALTRQHKHDAAIELAQARLELIPNDGLALASLSQLMGMRGDFARAEAYGRRGLAQGDLAGLYNNVAWYGLFRPAGVPPTAIDEARRAMELEPESPSIIHTLATLYAETGQLNEAYELLAKLMAKDITRPPEPSAFYVHGRIAEHLGLTRAAADAYRRAMGSAPEDGFEDPQTVRSLARLRLARLPPSAVAVPTP